MVPRKCARRSTASGNRVVLVVDDDPSILRACSRSLAHLSPVVMAADSKAALERARTVLPHIAIVDLRLGSESGIPVVRALRNLRASMKIALLSGYLSIDDAVTAVKAGADVVLETPRRVGRGDRARVGRVHRVRPVAARSWRARRRERQRHAYRRSWASSEPRCSGSAADAAHLSVARHWPQQFAAALPGDTRM